MSNPKSLSLVLIISCLMISQGVWGALYTKPRPTINRVSDYYPFYPPPHTCGNNIKEYSEDCDDGNTDNWDGCSSTCKIETPACGNGIHEYTEQCDDGNNTNGDGCSSICHEELGWICYGNLGEFSYCNPVGAP